MFISLKILHYFNKKYQFYIHFDINKEFGFDIHVYHLENPGITTEIIKTISDSLKCKNRGHVTTLVTWRLAPRRYVHVNTRSI